MSLDFERCVAEEYCIKVADGTHDSPKEVDYGKKLVTSKNIIGGKLDLDKSYFISLGDFDDINKRSKVDQWDILISMIGTVGEVALITEKPDFAIKNVGLLKNDNEYKAKWLYYYLKSDLGQYQIKSRLRGTTQLYIPLKDLRKLEISVPKDHDDMIKIIKILDNIDKKIENNLNINNNLEEQIETIYNSFFVYYDDFSKEELEECEIGLIPKTWNLISLGELTTQIKEKVKNNEYPVFSAVNTGNLILSEEYFDKQVFSKSIEKYIVVKQKEFAYNPARINIGSIGRNEFDFVGCVSPVYVGFKVEEGYENFMNMFIKSKQFNQWVIMLASGSVRQTLNYADFSIIKIPYPPKYLIEKFNIIYESYYELINHNKAMINNLEKIRDILLPKLMSGEIDVSKINCDLKLIIKKNHIKIHKPYYMEDYNMKTKIISKIQNQMKPFLNQGQYLKLTNSLLNSFKDIEILDNNNDSNESDNNKLLTSFLSAKQVEGRSEKTLIYYKSTLEKMLEKINKQVYNITTDDIRKYLYEHKQEKNSSKITIDNIRRIFSSFFSWLEDEDYILKNPVRRIHRVKTGRVVKEVLTDENLEILRDQCKDIRDLALIEILISTGIRVGELVKLNIDDIDFYERECVVFGKGESERIVYFDARTKIHLIEYLESRNDENPALFVSLNKPNKRLGISGVETRLRELGKRCNIHKVHPHKFRRTLATNAIDKGMPIEQVQKLLGHVQIDTTMQYAMVNQSNVKIAHRKFIS